MRISKTPTKNAGDALGAWLSAGSADREYRYHFFLAYAAPDRIVADTIYESLAKEFAVFMAARDLLPGEPWDTRIPEAQRRSLVSLVLVSKHTAKAHYQLEEINAAIRLSRKTKGFHRVVPVRLNPNQDYEMPYGLDRLQSVEAVDLRLVERLRELLGSEAAYGKRPFLRPSKGAVQVSTSSYLLTGSSDQHAWFGKGDEEPWLAVAQPPVDRHFLEQGLWERVQRHQDGTPRSLVYCDLDGATAINRRFGSPIGDEVIAAAGALIEKCADQQYSTRCGKDEFLIYLEGVDCKSAQHLARNISNAIQRHRWSRLAPSLYVTACCGVSQIQEAEQPIDWVLRAIHGSRQAKREGPGSVAAAPFVLPKEVSRNLIDNRS